MKKLYFLLMALLVSFAAGAVDYVICGNINSWNTKDHSLKFTANGDGTYTLTVASLPSGFKIKSAEDGWNNAYNYGAPKGSTLCAPGTKMTLVNGNNNDNITLSSTLSNVTLVFNPSEPSLLIQTAGGNTGGGNTGGGNTGGGEVTPYTGNLYLVGAFNEWTLADANYKFTKSGSNYTLTLPALNGQFKINGGSWASPNFGGDTGGEDVETVDAAIGDNTVWDGSSVNLVANNWTNVTLSLAWDGSSESATLTVSTNGGSTGGGEQGGEQGGGEQGGGSTTFSGNLYLVGAFNEWTLADANYKFTKSGSNYTLTLPALNGQFKINGGSWDSPNFGGDTGGEDVETVDAAIGDNTLWDGSTVNLVANNLTNVTLSLAWDGTSESATLTVSTNGGGSVTPPTPGDYPEVLYVICNDEHEMTWNIATGYEAVADAENEGVYYADIVIYEATEGSGKGYMSVCSVVGPDWDEDVNSGDRWGAAEEGAVLAVGIATDLTKYTAGVNASACSAFQVPVGSYSATIDLAAGTILLNSEAGSDDPVTPTLKGDVNSDGEVNISDAQEIINIMLGN